MLLLSSDLLLHSEVFRYKCWHFGKISERRMTAGELPQQVVLESAADGFMFDLLLQ